MHSEENESAATVDKNSHTLVLLLGIPIATQILFRHLKGQCQHRNPMMILGIFGLVVALRYDKSAHSQNK